MKKIYIAGKITGEVDTKADLITCTNKFNLYGMKLLGTKDISENLNFLFPHRNNISIQFTHGLHINRQLIKSGKGTYQQYMINDITTLLTCDEVHFLPDWINSFGAKLEHRIAKSLGMKIIYAN